ncbi:TPA: hypothetical protein ACGW5B_005833 [Bacillus paranthracis]
MKKFLVIFLLFYVIIPFDVHAESIKEDVSKKMLMNLQKANNNFAVYRDLNEVNYNGIKYFLYEKDGKYNLIFTNGTTLVKVLESDIVINFYGTKIMDLDKKSTQNFYVFDKDGKLIESSFKNNPIELKEPKVNFIFSNYAEGVPSWGALEGLNGILTDEDGSSIPSVILKVFNKMWEFLSDIGKSITNFFVPENAMKIMSDFFGGFIDKIKLQFKTIFDYVDGIVKIFEPKIPMQSSNKNSFMAPTSNGSSVAYGSSDFDPANPTDQFSNKDFYFIEFEINNPFTKESVIIQPFVGMLALSWEIYLLCNASLVLFTIMAVYRKIVGDGGVFDK